MTRAQLIWWAFLAEADSDDEVAAAFLGPVARMNIT